MNLVSCSQIKGILIKRFIQTIKLVNVILYVTTYFILYLFVLSCHKFKFKSPLFFAGMLNNRYSKKSFTNIH